LKEIYIGFVRKNVAILKTMRKIGQGNKIANTASNGRFGAMAAVSPQTILWEIARYYPAASSVEAATAPSRWDVICHLADIAVQTQTDFYFVSFVCKLTATKRTMK